MSPRARHGIEAIAAVVIVVVVALGFASLALDSYVHHHERQILTQLEARLGRKVEVGRLSASLFSGLTAEHVTVAGSRGAGDHAPLVTIERIRVRPSLVRTLVTFGHRAQIADIRVDRPTLNVVRLQDGRLDVDELAEHWRKSAPSAQPAAPMPERTRRMIENARIRRARITDGRLHFVDRAAGNRAVDVASIDLTLADLGIRRHPSLDLRAAVMAAQPNLELRARLGEAGSLEQLPPPVESAQVKLARTD
ncbi:MAG TPA: hypothetical protein VHB97_08695, partial [Polyangia bacterium]|nr:hypothetical protein [Polyangia bacterium]